MNIYIIKETPLYFVEMSKRGRIKAAVIIFAIIFLSVLTGIILNELGSTMNTILFIFFLLCLSLAAMRSPTLAVFLFFVTIPLANIGAIHILKATIRLHVLFGILCIIVIFYHLFCSEKKETIWRRISTPIDIPLLLLLIIMIISIIQTIYLPINPTININRIYNYPWIKSITKIILLTIYIGIFYAIQAILQSKDDIKRWILQYISIGSIVALYGLLAFVIFIVTGHNLTIDGNNAIVVISDDLPRIKATEQEPSFFGFYLITIIPILLALIIRQRKEEATFYNNKFLLIAATIILLTLFLSGSRSALLGFFFSVFTLFLFYKEQRSWRRYWRDIWIILTRNWEKIKLKISPFFQSRKKLLICVLISIIFFSLFFLIYHWDIILPKIQYGVRNYILNPTIGTFDSSYGKFWSTRTRLVMYGYALDAFQQHPWFGVGYENYNFYTGAKTYLGLLAINITWPEVNNYPLKILAEQGIIGFLAFLFLVVVFFFHLIQARNRTHDSFLKALLEGSCASFVGIAIILLFTSNITRPYIWVSIAFAIATIKIAYEQDKN